MKDTTSTTDSEAVRQKVREGYGQIAVAGSPRNSTGGGCCGSAAGSCGSAPADPGQLARHIGYSAEELAALPEGANMGLSCGNPNALASLQPGEVVLDLGSGGGFDVFIAGKKVGSSGRAIGVDMTSEMLAKARKNLAAYRQTTGLDNVEFRLGEIEHLPVADASVDAIISNCVINLSPDKPQVWREISRVLKPGGRVAVSDLALLKPLPPAILEMVEALIGCVAGAVLVSETERMAREAGLADIVLNPKSGYIDGMVDWQDPLYQKIIASLPAGAKPGEYITSLELTARKPGSPTRAKSSVRLEIYDPAMCCSTGVCGPEVDPVLVRFAADLNWLEGQGAKVQRFNLSQSPAAFVAQERVKQALTDRGEAALPMVLAGDHVLCTGRYPEREELAAWAGLISSAPGAYSPAVNELVAIGAAIAANCEPCLKLPLPRSPATGGPESGHSPRRGNGRQGEGLASPGHSQTGRPLDGSGPEQTAGRTGCLLRRANTRGCGGFRQMLRRIRNRESRIMNQTGETSFRRFLEGPTRFLFFTGKGGVGKTSLACATAIALADRGLRVLLVSTDPASNLDEVLGVTLRSEATPIPRVPHLSALNIDPGAAARAYRERLVGPYRGKLPEPVVRSMEEQLSGACTMEIAAFDEFARLLGEPAATVEYDHVIFDTAPTGHTLRLLSLPGAWTGFLDTNTSGTSCLGPLAGLQKQRSLYEGSVAALGDGNRTTLVLVSRAQKGALDEAERTSKELAAIGVRNQRLVLNAMFRATSPQDPVATALEGRGRRALTDKAAFLATLPAH